MSFFVSYGEYEEAGYDGYYSPEEDLSNLVLIHDDIIQYIQDTLNWIPSINPAMNYQKRFGLCNYGITLFDKEGANAIYNLAKAWADLYEVDRDKLVVNFRKLQLFSRKVILGDYLILHYGI